MDYRGEARAYPTRILVFHEIVNDTVAGEPIAISYCPLCGSGLTFRRVLDGKVLEFGVSGLLGGAGSPPESVSGREGIYENWGQLASLGNLSFIVVFALVAFLARNSTELAADRSCFELSHSLLVASALVACILLGISSTAPEFLYFNF